MTWQDTIRSILRGGAPDEYEFAVFEVRPASHALWPLGLVATSPLQEFYALCDGGYLAHLHWASLNDLSTLTVGWIEQLRDYDRRGDVLSAEEHVVFAIDADGCPVTWSATTGAVRSFFFKGGDWELLADSFEEFATTMFVTDPSPSDWARFVSFYRARLT